MDKIQERADLAVSERVTDPAQWVNPLVTVGKKLDEKGKQDYVRI